MSATAEGAVASSGRASNRTVRTAVRRGGAAADSAGDAARWQRSHWAGPSSPSSAGAGMPELDGQEPQANGSLSGRSVAGCVCGNPASSHAAAAIESHQRCARAVFTLVQLRSGSVRCQGLRSADSEEGTSASFSIGQCGARGGDEETESKRAQSRRSQRPPRRCESGFRPRSPSARKCGGRSSPTAGTAALTDRQTSGDIHPRNARGRYARQTQLRIGPVCA